MKKMALLSILFIFAGPMDLPAFSGHRPAIKPIGSDSPTYPFSQDMRSRLNRSARRPSDDMRSRHKRPARLSVDPGSRVKPVHPTYPGYTPGKPGHGRPAYWWPANTIVVREVKPVIIVNDPPPAEPAPPPEPEEVWVPPVMDTRTEPGYWDYGIRKVWMGDHWRYEQDFDQPTWVPDTQVEYVKQEGYWKTER